MVFWLRCGVWLYFLKVRSKEKILISGLNEGVWGLYIFFMSRKICNQSVVLRWYFVKGGGLGEVRKKAKISGMRECGAWFFEFARVWW